MAFPTGTQIETENLNSAQSNPSLAREDLLLLAQTVNQLIASENANSGVAVLNSSGKFNQNQVPSTLAPQGDITLAPSGGAVTIQSVLRLTQVLTQELGTLAGTETPSQGDLVYLVDGDAGNPCLAVYTGTDYRIVRFGTSVGAVSAALEFSSQITTTVDP